MIADPLIHHFLNTYYVSNTTKVYKELLRLAMYYLNDLIFALVGSLPKFRFAAPLLKLEECSESHHAN